MEEKKNFYFTDKRLKKFIYLFSGSNCEFKYRQQLLICANLEENIFPIYLDDLIYFDKKLYSLVSNEPLVYLNYFELSINRFINQISLFRNSGYKIVLNIQVILIRKEDPVLFPNFSISEFNKLKRIKVKIISSSPVRVRINKLKSSDHEEQTNQLIFKEIFEKTNFNQKHLGEEMRLNTQNFFLRKEDFVDFQILKALEISEKFEDETNSSPFLSLIVERELVNRLIPDNQVIITGIFLPFGNIGKNYEKKNQNQKQKQKQNLHKDPIFQVLGFYFSEQSSIPGFISRGVLFYKNFLIFAKSKKVYNWIFSSISPELIGFEGLKRGVACLLFGGSLKYFTNQGLQNGNFNILIVGNQNNLKIKLMNFVKKISGFSSSETTFEGVSGNSTFPLKIKKHSEGFLSEDFLPGPGGVKIICINDLEKLKMSDRVLLYSFSDKSPKMIEGKNYLNSHKGISILASVNITKSNENFTQPSFCASALSGFDFSKFDLVFFLSEKQSEKYDQTMVTRTFNYFKEKTTIFQGENEEKGEITFEMFKNYINFSRLNFNPQLSKKAGNLIQNAYLLMRISQKKNLWASAESFFLISIRHLESMIKISESLSKMRMSNWVNSNDALEAIKIIKEGVVEHPRNSFFFTNKVF
mmetsp:Transcript_8236/g.16444  ORF Transcript_8236/g.16444 Transcript_8236/m.16444 type:complete len:640 (+) Transcript_8236:433-2352(+)